MNGGLNYLRPIFEKFTKYDIVMTVDKHFRYNFKESSLMAASPHQEKLKKLISYYNLNRIYFDNENSIINYFGPSLAKEEEMNPDVLLIPI